ncbi:glucosylglycerol-phosphate synthase [Jannaschia seohaensis]|uniref:Glucosylglycerol-phosphate synthase n=1 Tax=Jannaschia seohaensis TaxID=475081 RepID=A0A2Y9A0V8_9RHOB|nr:glucosylglycerol-phosphate synthase [Jannaschia seohaensis]PWJ21893.1 glucosylglycerol-phosphate synthase [Jannaschia seohaensis]SSA38171.1 glucosylglycerol-phosphate synthase [Jannaschia seohaensis]
MSSELVIVYHRQPYEEVEEDGKIVLKENKSPNGIVPTLKSFFGSVDHGAWIAWKLADDPNNPEFEQKIEISDAYGDYTVSRLPLTSKQVSEFYHVTSKEAFWPILHSFKEQYNYDPVDWANFRDVNRRFAEAAAAEAAQGALVWVHDYNLWLVPGYLREMRPDVRIAFFHHTPFPAADMFNVLPWRKEIVRSLLACDDVGFHIPRFAANFVSVARSLFEVDVIEREKVPEKWITEGTALTERSVPTRLAFEDREVSVSYTPLGVDVRFIEERAESDEAATSVEEIRRDLGDAKLILSVGRTDYTKGGVQQLESFERVLEANPDLIGKIRLMHVSVAANRNMTAYREIQNEIEQIAGRINGRFGTLEWQPIALISRAIPFVELVAYYQAADVAWITPLADGMNLVCKEFIASRLDGDGVLVLSEFAGAAVELGDAVITNPFSHKAMDHAILAALSMPEEARRDRMRRLREAVTTNDVRCWGPGRLSIERSLSPVAAE